MWSSLPQWCLVATCHGSPRRLKQRMFVFWLQGGPSGSLASMVRGTHRQGPFNAATIVPWTVCFSSKMKMLSKKVTSCTYQLLPFLPKTKMSGKGVPPWLFGNNHPFLCAHSCWGNSLYTHKSPQVVYMTSSFVCKHSLATHHWLLSKVCLIDKNLPDKGYLEDHPT